MIGGLCDLLLIELGNLLYQRTDLRLLTLPVLVDFLLGPLLFCFQLGGHIKGRWRRHGDTNQLPFGASNDVGYVLCTTMS